MRKTIFVLVLLVLLMLCPVLSHGTTQYTIIDLGEGFEPAAINNAGQVVGSCYPDGMAQPYLWANGQTQALPAPGPYSLPTGINSAGWVTGMSYSSDWELTGTVWDGGAPRNIALEAGYPGFGFCQGLNDQGQVVGTQTVYNADIDQYLTRGFVWTEGNFQFLDTPDGYEIGNAMAINNLGQVAGNIYPTGTTYLGCLWDNGIPTELGTLGGNWSNVIGINDAGVIIGGANLIDGYLSPESGFVQFQHAFAWQEGNMLDLGVLGTYSVDHDGWSEWGVVGYDEYQNPIYDWIWHGDPYTELVSTSAAWDINASGQIIGYSSTSAGSTHPFLSENGSMADLNAFLFPNSGWELLSSTGINDSGQIVGTGWFSTEDGGSLHGYMLIPTVVPEPSSLAVVAGGLMLLTRPVFCRRRRNPKS